MYYIDNNQTCEVKEYISGASPSGRKSMPSFPHRSKHGARLLNDINKWVQAVSHQKCLRNRVRETTDKNWKMSVPAVSRDKPTAFFLDKSRQPCWGNATPIPTSQTCKLSDIDNLGNGSVHFFTPECHWVLVCSWGQTVKDSYLNKDTVALTSSSPLLDYGRDLQ